jgi:hypothetical protein
MSTVFTVLFCVLGLRVIIMAVDIDPLTTLEVWSSLISRVVIAMACAVSAIFAARAWFAPRVPARERLARYKRDRVGVWCLFGVASIAVQAALAAWESGGFLGAAAQYLDGPRELRRGTVTSLLKAYTPATVCRRFLEVRSNGAGQILHICLETDMRPSLATGAIKLGDTVRLHLRQTALGIIVVSVEPTQQM